MKKEVTKNTSPSSVISPLYQRIEAEIDNYLTQKVEISEGVKFSQYELIKRLYKFRNRDLSGTKINADLSYEYYFDIISPRVDSEVKNLRFDSKNILLFSRNPSKDFPAVFIGNAMLKSWMAEDGEDEVLKTTVEEYSSNGNVIFKKTAEGYELCDPLNTYPTNQTAKTICDTDLIERHSMTAPELVNMTAWDQDKIKKVIKDFGGKTFTATEMTADIDTTNKRYEIFEYTGIVSDKEYKMLSGDESGDEHKYYLAKVVIAGLKKGNTGERLCLFSEKLKGDMDEYYIDAHRGKYEGRFWRVGVYELLFDYQIRANQIGNDLAKGLEWASKVVFQTTDSSLLQNIRADLENGDVIIAKDLKQVDVRLQSMDQLIADWNRLMADADRLTNSLEVVRGENLPSGTPFRMGILMDQNAGKMFVFLRQKITLPYKRVFREWVLPRLIKKLKGEEVFRLVGDTQIIDQFREVAANSWYMQNLVKIGPHTKEVADAIIEEKMDELKKVDPVIENSEEIWKGIMPRLFVTITGENSDLADNVQDMVQLMNLEQDPIRRAYLLDTVYKLRNIPIPPAPKEQPQPQGGMADVLQGGQQSPEQMQDQPVDQPVQ